MNGNSQTGILSYQDVSLWYGSALVLITDRIRSSFSRTQRDEIDVSSRVKTIDTLRAKLLRQPDYAINRIHDVMGVRIVADMGLDRQNEITRQICKSFDKTQISDLRDDSHSGYRAVHVAVILPGSVCAEIQIRTTLQDDWANCYELAADIFGREIRYGDYPSDKTQNDIVCMLQKLSDMQIAHFENTNTHFTNLKTEATKIFAKLDGMKNLDEDVIKLRNTLVEYILHGTQITNEKQQDIRKNIQGFRNMLETYSSESK